MDLVGTQIQHTTAVEGHTTSPCEVMLIGSNLLHCLLRRNISSRKEHLGDEKLDLALLVQDIGSRTAVVTLWVRSGREASFIWYLAHVNCMTIPSHPVVQQLTIEALWRGNLVKEEKLSILHLIALFLRLVTVETRPAKTRRDVMRANHGAASRSGSAPVVIGHLIGYLSGICSRRNSSHLTWSALEVDNFKDAMKSRAWTSTEVLTIFQTPRYISTASKMGRTYSV